MTTTLTVEPECYSIELDNNYNHYLFVLENEGDIFRSLVTESKDNYHVKYRYPFKTELTVAFLISINKENSNDYHCNRVVINTAEDIDSFQSVSKQKYCIERSIEEKKIIYNGSYYRLA